MKTVLSLAFLLASAAALSAQAPAEKARPAEKKQAQPAAAQPAAAPAAAAAPAGEAKPAKQPKASQKQSDPEDDGTVLIDSRGDADDGARYEPASEAAQPEVPGGLPSSYGQCRGVINDAGRSVLVFENPEDGVISFVQVFFVKSGVSWKLVDRVGRSLD